jgi:hypothetical protein
MPVDGVAHPELRQDDDCEKRQNEDGGHRPLSPAAELNARRAVSGRTAVPPSLCS